MSGTQVFAYGKHKSFSEFIKISEKRRCIREMDAFFSHSFFHKKDIDENQKVKFFIFSRKKDLITGTIFNSSDRIKRKSPLFLSIRLKDSFKEKNWERYFLKFNKVYKYMDSLKDTDFNSFMEINASIDYLKNIEIDDHESKIKNSIKTEDFILNFLRNSEKKIKSEKRIIFPMEKKDINAIIQVIYLIRKNTGIKPFSFFIKEDKKKYLFAFFYKKFSKNDLKEIWVN